MKKLEIELFNEESFVYNCVNKMDIDLNKKIAKICINGAYLNNNLCLNEAELEISNWSKVEVKFLNEQTKLFEEVKAEQYRQLDAIIEFKL